MNNDMPYAGEVTNINVSELAKFCKDYVYF